MSFSQAVVAQARELEVQNGEGSEARIRQSDAERIGLLWPF